MNYLCAKDNKTGFALLKDYLPEYTYNDYCKWEGRWEIIEGYKRKK